MIPKDRTPNACAVYSPQAVKSWYKRPSDLDRAPLANYILTRFKTVDQRGEYHFMIRRERQLDLTTAQKN